MTSSTPPDANGNPNSPAALAHWPSWAREPLLHFLLAGALLFGLDALLVARQDDPHRIVVSAAVDADAKQAFKAARGHEPNAAELQALRQVYLDNEVLYREGIAMGLDKGDTAIRERVIFKALSMVDAGTKPPVQSEEILQRWFEKNRARYENPMRFTFDEAVFAGESNEQAVKDFVKALNAGEQPELQAGLRVFRDRPVDSVTQTYGQPFATALAALSPNVWQALQDKQGWRAIRLSAVAAAIPADFATLRNVIQQDWTDAMMAEQRSAAVRAMAAKYRIEYPK